MAIDSLPILPESRVAQHGSQFAMVAYADGCKCLAVSGEIGRFEGSFDTTHDVLLAPLNTHNASILRNRLPWLRPVPLGTQTSAGFGDRLGCATPGHVLAVRGTGVAPIFAQQSVRENARTGRTPQQVMDDAMWGVFEAGWQEWWGADADHLKQVEDIKPFVEAGFTFFTIDPGNHVDDQAADDDPASLRAKAAALDWATLDTTLDDLLRRYQGQVRLDGLTLELSEEAALRAAVKYGAAIAHTKRMASTIQSLSAGRSFDLEVSVDETATTTSHIEHYVIVSELLRLNVPFVSLAPRFVGRFEKGVDYIGSVTELDIDLAAHAALIRHFGNRYKLSLHTGSDKFGVYPVAMRHTRGLLHLKTAGTSYLEALRVMASVDPALFRQVMRLACDRYAEDRRTYHVSADLRKVPPVEMMTDTDLPALLNHFDARQALHVTFGSVLDQFNAALRAMLHTHSAAYHAALKTHFDRHLAALRRRVQ
jgi:hypothetical protein